MFSSAAASNGTPGPVGLTLVMGGSLYIQKAFWLAGTQPSAETVQAFKRAHAEACQVRTEDGTGFLVTFVGHAGTALSPGQAVGMDNVKVAAEQELFDTPMIWNLQAEDDPRCEVNSCAFSFPINKCSSKSAALS